MAEAAEGPDVAAATDWERAAVMPEIGSDFPGGHIPLAGFFLPPQPEGSIPFGEETPFV